MSNEAPVAQLPTISQSELESCDSSTRLIQACVNSGFFYLELPLQNQDGMSWNLLQELERDANSFFNLSVENKMQISMDSTGTYYGYKPIGANVVDERGNLDQNEFLNISRQDCLFDDFSLLPPSYEHLISQDMKHRLTEFVSSCHDLLVTILTRISEALALDSKDYLSLLHPKTGISGDHLRFVKYTPAQTSASRPILIPHTDFGSLTFLHTDQPGLQVLDPATNNWAFVMPKAQHVVINVGDALVKLTNGYLRSCLHRVIYPGTLQGVPLKTKLSVGYFLRPQDDVPLTTVKSMILDQSQQDEVILTKDWIARRVNASKVATFAETRNWSSLKGTASQWN